MSESERQSIDSLVRAIEAQTEAINNLANSNALLASAIADQLDDEVPGGVYLDGSNAA
ncbi:hypothetical protein Q2E61_09280 [Microbulbifer thermotolerans]|uniref:hypothetical protein n=1 Tax=Microbulbifer thermotolerans TaxID=252514 RepID=UPI0026730FD1|nr:hypothetical protein [Microbulbifer thermotolerans]WKT59119.1 hypothetical protein Q2E61_09280 [Microbulbifer thermotolerans]